MANYDEKPYEASETYFTEENNYAKSLHDLITREDIKGSSRIDQTIHPLDQVSISMSAQYNYKGKLEIKREGGTVKINLTDVVLTYIYEDTIAGEWIEFTGDFFFDFDKSGRIIWAKEVSRSEENIHFTLIYEDDDIWITSSNQYYNNDALSTRDEELIIKNFNSALQAIYQSLLK